MRRTIPTDDFYHYPDEQHFPTARKIVEHAPEHRDSQWDLLHPSDYYYQYPMRQNHIVYSTPEFSSSRGHRQLPWDTDSPMFDGHIEDTFHQKHNGMAYYFYRNQGPDDYNHQRPLREAAAAAAATEGYPLRHRRSLPNTKRSNTTTRRASPQYPPPEKYVLTPSEPEPSKPSPSRPACSKLGSRFSARRKAPPAPTAAASPAIKDYHHALAKTELELEMSRVKLEDTLAGTRNVDLANPEQVESYVERNRLEVKPAMALTRKGEHEHATNANDGDADDGSSGCDSNEGKAQRKAKAVEDVKGLVNGVALKVKGVVKQQVGKITRNASLRDSGIKDREAGREAIRTAKTLRRSGSLPATFARHEPDHFEDRIIAILREQLSAPSLATSEEVTC